MANPRQIRQVNSKYKVGRGKLGIRKAPSLLTVSSAYRTTMGPNTASLGLLLHSIISPLGLLWTWVRRKVSGALPETNLSARTPAVPSATTLGPPHVRTSALLLSAAESLLYWIKVLTLTGWAYLSNQSFITRRPGYPPHFLGHPSSRDIHVFDLTPNDILHIYDHSGRHLRNCRTRHWHPEWKVKSLLNWPPSRSVPYIGIDLTTYHLVGRHLAQGYGIIGHDFCAALVQEYGRWPGEPSTIGGAMFLWDSNRLVNAKLPISHVAAPGIQETIETIDTTVTMEWQELGTGMLYGPKTVATFVDSAIIPVPPTENPAAPFPLP